MVVEFKKRFSSPTKRPDLLWGPIHSSIIWVLGHFFLGSGVKIGRGVMLTTYVHLVPRLSAATLLHCVYAFMTRKGKVHPRTDHEDPEGEHRYSSALSLISALDKGGWSALRTGRFTP